MSLNIGDALSTGAKKLTTTAGIQLSVIYVVLQLLIVIGTNSVIGSIETGAGTTGMATPMLALPIGAAGGAALAVLAWILSIALTIVALRTMAHDTSELGSIPSGVADNMLKTWVFLVIAMIVEGIIVVLGFIALIIPGIFLMVSLIFTQIYVAVEGEGPLQALSASWGLAKGDRFPLFGLGVIVTIISLLISIPPTIVTLVSPPVGTVLNYVLSGFVGVFTIAVMVAAYQQLSDGASTTTIESDDDVERLDDDSGFDYA